MKNETKNEQANIGQAAPKFQQAEPEEINEADLQGVAGGVYDRKAGATKSCE